MRTAERLGGQGVADALLERAAYRVTDVTVYSYESEAGTTKIPAAYVAAVAEAFNYDPTWLLTGEGSERPVEPGDAENRLALFDELTQLLPLLSRGDVRDAADVARALRAVRKDLESRQGRTDNPPPGGGPEDPEEEPPTEP